MLVFFIKIFGFVRYIEKLKSVKIFKSNSKENFNFCVGFVIFFCFFNCFYKNVFGIIIFLCFGFIIYKKINIGIVKRNMRKSGCEKVIFLF